MSHAPPAGSIELNLERNNPGGWDIPGSFPKIHTTRELDTTIPAIAKSPNLMSDLDEFLRSRSTSHDLVLAVNTFSCCENPADTENPPGKLGCSA